MSITEIAIKRPLLILVIFIVLILFGIMSYFNLNYNLLPKMKINIVSISTIYPGASASEVENSVTKKLEDAFASIEGLDQINSTSQEGLSQITVSLKSDADVDKAERDIQRKADQAKDDLPDDIQSPIVSKIDLEETPVIKAGVTAMLAPRELYEIIDKQMKPILQNVAGVGMVNIIGGDERQIQVNVNMDKLNAYHINIAHLSDIISKASISFPAGSIENRNQQMSIRYDANINSIEQIKKIIISRQTNGSTIYLNDIAEVIDATAKTTAINHINGIPSVGIQIIKQTDANAVDVSAKIKKKFKELESQYASQEFTFAISSDQSIYTLAAANGVMEDLLLAIIIVGIVMLAFLHSFRSSMFVLIALPSSIIPTFIAMYLLGFSLNMMTLMAMSLVVGILVDDSIVVLENIYRHMEMGSDRRKAALDGRNEIGFTAMAITMVDVVVFLPLALSGGLIGRILREFSLVVVISTLMSLFVSFTITPLLASRFGRLEHLSHTSIWGKINIGFENLITQTKEIYAKLLNIALHKKRWLLSGILVLLIGSIMLIAKGFIGASFIPSGDQGELLINLELDPSATIYQTNMATQEAEKLILLHPEVKMAFSSIGFVSGSAVGANNNNNKAEITVTLVDNKERSLTSTEFGTMIQRHISEKIPGVKTSASTSSIAGNSTSAPLQIAVRGLDLIAIRNTANEIKSLVESVAGTEYVELSVKDQKQEVEINLNREKMTSLGLDASMVGASLQNAFNGNDNTKFKQYGNEYNILISLDRYNRSNITDVKNLVFANSDGKSFVLNQFADVKHSLGESVLQRNNRMGSITINSGIICRPLGDVTNDIKAKISSITMPKGITIEYLGDVKRQEDTFSSLGIALITALLLVYLIMVALYDNAVYPFVVLFSIPVALIGALLALALTMETLNIFSIIGMIMLLGLVSKNAILIVDFTNQLRREGKTVIESLIEAGKERLRPILMTTLAMILGMLPIALAGGAGAELKNGMAWVIIGGLTSSMILTLFVVPAMYLIIENIIHKHQKQKNKIVDL